MNAQGVTELPTCEVVTEDPSRPPALRRAIAAGMRFSGHLATIKRRLWPLGANDSFGILTYHRVAPCEPGFAPPMHNVLPSLFRQQLVGLRQQGFRFASLRDVLAWRERKEKLAARTVVVTFDDGFESVHEHAWPVLRELGIPATIFVNTAYLDQQEPFPFDAWGNAYADQVPRTSYRPLTTAQCTAMMESGLIEIGAHTHTHADFRGRPDAFRRDMQVCLRHLREKVGVERPAFAFPFGSSRRGYAGAPLVDVVRELGLPCALSTDAVCVRLCDLPFHWGRFNVFDWDTPSTLAAKLLGFYRWPPRVIEWLAALRKRQLRINYRAATAPGGGG
jgi:peptidoglycan/xylan/chitin deacetylase (PgdA/CDA1 family)